MLKPFVKWPGGKSSELSIIHKHLPAKINNYIEPFLGGGACFLSLNPEKYRLAFLNDISEELISIYSYIKSKNEIFNTYLQEIGRFWNYFGDFADNNYDSIREIYNSYKEDQISKDELKEVVKEFVTIRNNEIDMGIPKHLSIDVDAFRNELRKAIFSKLITIRKNEIKRGILPEEDYKKNFEAGIKGAVYIYNRYLYNQRAKLNIPPELHIALFFFLREFCYSSMFRYNKNGEFNVPYGGASYNGKDFMSKIEYIWSQDLGDRLKGVQLSHLDFREFINGIELQKQDFIFVDPPYDTEFSTYANNDFDLNDQQRLANYLLNDCPAHFMLIIKNTEFIYSLYNRPGIRIIGFDKEYQVSFMDRNEKAVNHLLIMNY